MRLEYMKTHPSVWFILCVLHGVHGGFYFATPYCGASGTANCLAGACASAMFRMCTSDGTGTACYNPSYGYCGPCNSPLGWSGSTCIPCPPGYFASNNGLCEPPPPGYYATGGGTYLEVLRCPEGTYCPWGSSAPNQCPVGSYCVYGASAPVPCTNAPNNAAYTTANVASSTCPWACASGFTLSTVGLCVAICPANTFCDSESIQRPCPSNR